jgi:hypothetical protein
MGRLENYLLADELDVDAVKHGAHVCVMCSRVRSFIGVIIDAASSSLSPSSDEYAISVRNATFKVRVCVGVAHTARIHVE